MPFLLRKALRTFQLSFLSCFLILSACSGGRESPLYTLDTEKSPETTAEERPGALTVPKTWTMQQGLLRGQLERWAHAANYQLVWNVSRDYYLQSSVEYSSTFQKALTELLTSMQKRGTSLRAVLYEGNRVVVVTDR